MRLCSWLTFHVRQAISVISLLMGHLHSVRHITSNLNRIKTMTHDIITLQEFRNYNYWRPKTTLSSRLYNWRTFNLLPFIIQIPYFLGLTRDNYVNVLGLADLYSTFKTNLKSILLATPPLPCLILLHPVTHCRYGYWASRAAGPGGTAKDRESAAPAAVTWGFSPLPLQIMTLCLALQVHPQV